MGGLGLERIHPRQGRSTLENGTALAYGNAEDELDASSQRVAAFVRVTEGRPAPTPQLEAALRAWVSETLAYFKVPAELRFVTEPLPRNATGKVLKHVLLGEQSAFIEE